MSSLVVFAIFCTVLFIIHRKLREKVTFFKRRKIIYDEPAVIFGNVGNVFFGRCSYVDILIDAYKRHANDRIVGFFNFNRPQLIICDTKIVRKILFENLDHFVNHVDQFSAQSLGSLNYHQWNEIKNSLDVIFDDIGMKQMFELMLKSTDEMIEYLNYKDGIDEEFIIDIKDLSKKFCVNSLASCLGIHKVNCFRNKNDKIFKIAEKISKNFGFIGHLKSLISSVFPNFYKAMNIQLVDSQTKEFFNQAVIEEMKVRQVKKFTRPDMIQLLLEAKNGQLHHYRMDVSSSDGKYSKSNENLRKLKQITWPDEYYIAIGYSLFSEGYRLSVNVLQMLCYELAKNYDIQMELIDEIDEINEKEGITYENLNNMKLLNMILDETLRLWPTETTQNQLCTKDYSLTTDDGFRFEFQKGDELIIPAIAIHRDAKHYDNPLTFEPHRFDMKQIEEAEYLPFNNGPRSFILRNFAMQLVKIFIYQLLTHFTLEMCHKTPSTIQLKQSFEFDVREKIYMRLKSRIRN
ncbi:probable cytochrome P450 9f2 [Chironomus tepperi]|uniref:probable cytochrome P450 9f2 n=1 Tax=Chironomus tepperi TaxID=113505 RepID=UPI00391EE835